MEGQPNDKALNQRVEFERMGDGAGEGQWKRNQARRASTDFRAVFYDESQRRKPGAGFDGFLAIMQEHDGRIEVESTEEAGTCVTLFLPDKAKSAAVSSNISEILAGKQILVAEDEPALAQLLGSLLSPLKAPWFMSAMG